MDDLTARLVGAWRTDPNDAWSLEQYGDVSLLFDEAGHLAYEIQLAHRRQVIELTYRAEGCFLVTDQPSSRRPHEERTEFAFTDDGRLALIPEPPAPASYYVRAR